MNVLVVGGAGYVGSHTAQHLHRLGQEVWVYDNLGRGHREAVIPGRLIEADLADTETLERVLADHQVDVVMHFAADALVGESVSDPARYYRNNVGNTLGLLDSMRRVNRRTKQYQLRRPCRAHQLLRILAPGMTGSVRPRFQSRRRLRGHQWCQ